MKNGGKALGGHRMIGGREYLLDGTVSGYTEDQAKENARAEAGRLRAQGKLVRLIKDSPTCYKVWIH